MKVWINYLKSFLLESTITLYKPFYYQVINEFLIYLIGQNTVLTEEDKQKNIKIINNNYHKSVAHIKFININLSQEWERIGDLFEKHNKLVNNNINPNINWSLCYKSKNQLKPLLLFSEVESRIHELWSKHSSRWGKNTSNTKLEDIKPYWSNARFLVYYAPSRKESIKIANGITNYFKAKGGTYSYNWCVSWERGNLFWNYRFNSNESLYYVIDLEKRLSDPLHVIVIGKRPDNFWMVTDAFNNHATELVDVDAKTVLKTYTNLKEVLPHLKNYALTEEELKLLTEFRDNIISLEKWKTLTQEYQEIYCDINDVLPIWLYKESSQILQHYYLYNYLFNGIDHDDSFEILHAYKYYPYTKSNEDKRLFKKELGEVKFYNLNIKEQEDFLIGRMWDDILDRYSFDLSKMPLLKKRLIQRGEKLEKIHLDQFTKEELTDYYKSLYEKKPLSI